MPAVMLRLTLSVGLLVLHAATFAASCQADLFSHCLGQCQPRPSQSWSASYPNTTTTCFAAGSSCNPATPTVLQHQLLSFAPQTTYRTRWTTVPVTSYRPITTTDPVTGCTVTCMRPCMTYQWQARRVPVTTLRPVHSTIAVNTAPLPTYHALPSTGLAAPSELGCGNEVPYYGSPSSQFPAAQFPATQSTLPSVPNSPSRPGASGLPNGNPADRPPTLDPRRLQGATSTNPYRVRLIPPTSDLADEQVPEREAPVREVPADVVPVREAPVRETQAGEVPNREVPAAVPVTTPPLQPIPDPDELNLEPATGSPAPNGRDKMADHGVSTADLLAVATVGGGRIVPISWPAGSIVQASSVEQRGERRSHPVLDDTGWTSLRP